MFRYCCALFISIVLLTGGRADAFPPVNDDDILILQVRLDRFLLSESTIGYLTETEPCLVLGDIVSALDFAIDVGPEKASGWFLREENTFELDLETGELFISGKKRNYPEGVILDDYGAPCVKIDELSRWFPVDLTADVPNAIIIADGRVPLPVEERAARKKRQAAIGQAINQKETIKGAKLPEYKLVSAPLIDFSFSAQTNNDEVTAVADIFATGDFAGMQTEILTILDDKRGLRGVRGRVGRASPRGILPGPLYITQAFAGDVSTPTSRLSTRSVSGRGLFVSNRDLDRGDEFDRTTLRGELPSGWEVELYRNGILLAFQKSKGNAQYEFLDIPLLFGRNNFKLIFYGPQGQVREDFRDVYVGDTLLKPGQIRFSAGVNEQNIPTFYLQEREDDPATGTLRASGKLEVGLTQSLSASVSASSYVAGEERREYLDGSLQASIGGMGVYFDASHLLEGGSAFGLALQRQIKGANVSLSLEEFADYESEVVGEISSDPLMTRGRFQADTAIQPLENMLIPIGLTLNWLKRESGRIDYTGSLRTSTSLGLLNITNQVNAIVSKSADGSKQGAADGSLLVSRSTGGLSIRGGANYQLENGIDLTTVNLSVDKTFSEKSGLGFDAGYDMRTGKSNFGIGYNAVVGNVTSGTFLRYSEGDGVSAGINLSTSIGKLPESSAWFASPRRMAGMGGAMIRAFVDENGDGILNEEEELLETAQASISGRPFERAINTPRGQFLPGLSAYDPVAIELNMLSIEDPYLVAGPGSRQALIPRPGAAPVINLPLVRSGEVVGEVYRTTGVGERGAADVELELVDADGHIMARTETEFDGFFVFEMVPYGSYTLRLAPAQASRLNMELDREPQLTLSMNDDIVEGMILNLINLAGEETLEAVTGDME